MYTTLYVWNDVKLSNYAIRKYNSFLDRRSSYISCWNWLGNTHENGYGVLDVSHNKRRSKLFTHRVAYYLHFGKDPQDELVCHRCDNRLCCNPNHLFLSTYGGNHVDALKKGRKTSPMKGKILCEHSCSLFVSYEPYYEIWALRREGFLLREIGSRYEISTSCVRNIYNNVSRIVREAIQSVDDAA